MASESTIARLLIDIGVDADDAVKAAKDIEGGLDKTEKQADKTGAAMKTLGKAFAAVGAAVAAAGGAVFAFVDKITATGDEIGKTSKKLGVGVEDLQRLRFAADRSGASASTLNTALRMQAQYMDQAARGGASEFRAALDGVGLTLEEIQGLGAEDRFALMADRIEGIADPAKKTALAMGLFGARAGAELVPLLDEGGKGIRALGDEAERLGFVMGEDAVAQSEAFQDTITNAKGVLEGVAREVGVRLIPVVEKVIKRFEAWATANRDLIRTKIERWATVAVDAFEVMAKALGLVLDNLDIFLGLAGGVALAKAFSAVAAGFSAMGLGASAALGPIGMIASALAALIPIAIKAGNAIGDAMAKKAGFDAGERVERGAPVSIGSMDVSKKTKRQIAAQNEKIREEERKLVALEKSGASGDAIRRQKEEIDAYNRGLARQMERAAEEDARRRNEKAAAQAADEAETAALLASGDLVLEGDPVPRPRGVGGGGKKSSTPKASKPTSDVTMGDLQVPGVDLDALAAKTPDADAIEPTIAMTIVNNSIDFDLSQTINGVGDASGVASRVGAEVRKQLDAAILAAARAMNTGVKA